MCSDNTIIRKKCFFFLLRFNTKICRNQNESRRKKRENAEKLLTLTSKKVVERGPDQKNYSER